MNLAKLREPFKENEIEWRIGQSGVTNGRIWANCLAYVSARAIMDRLDEVCGPEKWKATYRMVSGSQGTDAGVICELSIKVGDEWVTKEDGAEQTDIESFKGGISAALKRAGSAWGIGRYLYSLEAGYATIVAQGSDGARWAKTKDGKPYYWVAPTLPAWALPKGEALKSSLPKISPDQPGPEDGAGVPTEGLIEWGIYKNRTFKEVGPQKLREHVEKLEAKAAKEGKAMPPEVQAYCKAAAEFVVKFEQGYFEETA